jgi:hypothetical protein
MSVAHLLILARSTAARFHVFFRSPRSLLQPPLEKGRSVPKAPGGDHFRSYAWSLCGTPSPPSPFQGEGDSFPSAPPNQMPIAFSFEERDCALDAAV